MRFKKIRLKKITEQDEQGNIIRWVKLQYPDIIINGNLGGIRLAEKKTRYNMKVLGNLKGYPDIIIDEPRGSYHGLRLELKKSGTKLKKLNGEWVSEHIIEQNKILERLRGKGYFAEFAIGFEEAINIIKNYMQLIPGY